MLVDVVITFLGEIYLKWYELILWKVFTNLENTTEMTK